MGLAHLSCDGSRAIWVINTECSARFRSSRVPLVGWYGYRHAAASPYDVPNRPHFPLWKYVHRAYGFLLFRMARYCLSINVAYVALAISSCI